MQPISNRPPRQEQITITSGEATPKRLIITLKRRENDLNTQENELKTKLDESVNFLSQSAFSKSMTQSSTKNLGDSDVYSLSDSEDLEDEDIAFGCIDTQEKLDVVQDEKSVVQDEINFVQAKENEREEISTLQLATGHLANILASEGTTALSAVATGGLALWFGGPVIAMGGALIAGNEILKMAYRYIQKEGASDHLMIAGNALEAIEKTNTLYEQSLERTLKHQTDTLANIGEIDVALKEYEEKLNTTIGEQNQNIQEVIAKLKLCRGALLQQNHDLNQTLGFIKKSMGVSQQQQEMLKALASAEYKIETPDDLKKVVEGINQEINNILALSQRGGDFQALAMEYLLKAITQKSDLISLHHDLTSALEKIELLQEEQKKNAGELGKIKEELTKAKSNTNKAVEETEHQKKLREEDKVQHKIIKESLESEKQKEHFTDSTIQLGGVLTGGAGATLGLALSGPAGALVLGGVALAGVGTCVMRAIHRQKLMKRTNETLKKKLELQGMKNDLESSKFQKNGKVTVTADFGYSQGSILGAKSYKTVWNTAGYLANYASGKELMGEYKSSHAGTVKCVIGSIPISFNFDKTTGPSLAGTYLPKYMDLTNSAATDEAHAGYVKYGAISQLDQQNFSALLLDELKEGTITPNMVLDLLHQLSETKVGNEVIAMIRKDSPHTEILRNLCKTMLEKDIKK